MLLKEKKLPCKKKGKISISVLTSIKLLLKDKKVNWLNAD
jgi:hypothetical protein